MLLSAKAMKAAKWCLLVQLSATSTCWLHLPQSTSVLGGGSLGCSLGLFVCLCGKHHRRGLFTLLGFRRVYSGKRQGQSG